MRNILLDTGPIVALLTSSDPHHGRAERFFSELRATDVLATTWPVITECSFILRRSEARFWDWLLGTDMEVAAFSLADIAAMRTWRNAYHDREIDFADTTLVWLANK